MVITNTGLIVHRGGTAVAGKAGPAARGAERERGRAAVEVWEGERRAEEVHECVGGWERRGREEGGGRRPGGGACGCSVFGELAGTEVEFSHALPCEVKQSDAQISS